MRWLSVFRLRRRTDPRATSAAFQQQIDEFVQELGEDRGREEPWTWTAGEHPGEMVLIDAAWVDGSVINLALERWGRVDDGEGNFTCTTEAEIADALIRYGADSASAAQSAGALWRANQKFV